MGIFSKKAKPPKKKIYLWTRDDVAKWLAYVNMTQYAEQLGPEIDGQGLLRLTAIDIYTMTSSRQDADILIQAIDALREDKALNQGALSTPVGSKGDAVTPGSSSQKGGEPNGQALSSLVGGNETVKELYQYLEDIGIRGTGLLEATSQSNVFGLIVSALWELNDVTLVAKANNANCKELVRYSQDILRVMDAQGKLLACQPPECFTELLQSLEEAINLVDNCGREGWLARMAVDERAVEHFQNVHNSILETLRAIKVDTLPNGRQLTHGDYRDFARPLKRLLKQLGNGSWEEGMRAVATADSPAADVMRLIGIGVEEIQQDARHFLEGLERVNSSGDDGLAITSPPAFSRRKECAVVFEQYAREAGALDPASWTRLLSDLGLLENVKPGDVDSYVLQQFAAADGKHDGVIDLEEFVPYYEGLKVSKAVHQLREALGPEAEKGLRKVFYSFASFGSRQPQQEMDGVRFSKFARDCKLSGPHLTQTDIDLTFAKVKTKGSRRITFDQFLDGLLMMAEKRGVSIGELVKAVLGTGGPAVSATKPEYVRLNDDKSTYTGVYARGGPTSVEPSKDLSALLDRSPADLRGVKKHASQNDTPLSSLRVTLPSTFLSPGTTPTSASGKGRSPKINALSASWAGPSGNENRLGMQALQEALEPVQESSLRSVYEAFASFGLGNAPRPEKLEMDGAKFAKLCRESGLLCSRFNTTAVDLIFSRAKQKGARKIEYCQFKRALELVAEEKKIPVEQVHKQLIMAGGPRRNATHADFVRLHDDKSTFTGVYAHGGPSVVDKRLTIEALIDRTNARKSMNFS